MYPFWIIELLKIVTELHGTSISMIDKRMRTIPVLFEAILPLRFNHRLWDLSTVRDAIMMVRNDRVQNRLDEDAAAEEKLHGDQY